MVHGSRRESQGMWLGIRIGQGRRSEGVDRIDKDIGEKKGGVEDVGSGELMKEKGCKGVGAERRLGMEGWIAMSELEIQFSNFPNDVNPHALHDVPRVQQHCCSVASAF